LAWTRSARTWRTRDEKIRARLARVGTGASLDTLQPETPFERTIRKVSVMLKANQRPRCANGCRKRMVVVYNRSLDTVVWNCIVCGSLREVDQEKFSAFVESISA
jgi:hypothetical protein